MSCDHGVEDTLLLVNIVEELVQQKVREALQDSQVCTCSLCEHNICAIVLNALEPKYVTSNRGSLFAQLDFVNREYLFNLNLEISKAMKIVNEKPFH